MTAERETRQMLVCRSVVGSFAKLGDRISASEATIMAEIAKCEIVCLNCHAMIECGCMKGD